MPYFMDCFRRKKAKCLLIDGTSTFEARQVEYWRGLQFMAADFNLTPEEAASHCNVNTLHE